VTYERLTDGETTDDGTNQGAGAHLAGWFPLLHHTDPERGVIRLCGSNAFNL
jgi:hypothetical protein